MKNALYLLLTICLISCGDLEYVRFETAQPAGVNESSSFDRKIKGEYINCSNSGDKLIIKDNLILNAQTFKLNTLRNDLTFDSTITIDKNNDDELSTFLERQGYKVKISGDTINAHQMYLDTIFYISDGLVLKKFKGSYFLNLKLGEDFWNVRRLDLTKDTLLIGQISPSDTLLRFDFVSKKEEVNHADSSTTAKYFLNPSRREFKKLMKPNSFETCKCYYKKK